MEQSTYKTIEKKNIYENHYNLYFTNVKFLLNNAF